MHPIEQHGACEKQQGSHTVTSQSLVLSLHIEICVSRVKIDNIRSPQATVKVVLRNPQKPNEEFGIHGSFITHYSLYFCSAFSTRPTTRIEIAGVDSGTFAAFIHWFYYQNIGDVTRTALQLVRIWAFGERFEVAYLQIL